MLAQMRSKKFVKRIMKWTLILVIPSFVFFYGYTPSGDSNAGQLPWYAKVKTRFGGLAWDKIQGDEMQQAQNQLNNYLANMGAGTNASRFLNNESSLRTAVNNRIQDELIVEYGFVTNSNELLPQYEMMQQIFAMQTGQMPSKEALASYITMPQRLGGMGFYNVEDFERSAARDLNLNKVQSAIAENVRPMLWEEWDYYRQSTQNLSLDYVDFLGTSYSGQVEVTTDSLKQFFAENSEQFRTEQQANYRYVIMPYSTILDRMEATDEECRIVYEEKSKEPGDLYWQGKSVDVSHIGLKLPFDANTTDTAQVKARLNAIWDELHQQPLPTFADIADKYTEDESNIRGERKLGGRLDLPIAEASDYRLEYGPYFATPALRIGEGQMIKIDSHQTEFGFHILKADRVTSAGPRPFSEVVYSIGSTIRDQKAEVAFNEEYARMTKEWDAVTDLGMLAERMGLEAKETGWVAVGGPDYLEGSLRISEFQNQIRRLNVKATSPKPLVSSSPISNFGKYCLVIQLLELREPFDPPFEEVRLAVEDAYRQREGAKLAIAAGQEFLNSIGQDDSLTSQAEQQELFHKTAGPFVRANASTILTRDMVGFAQESLEATTGTLGLSKLDDVDNPQGCYIWQVKTITEVKMEDFNNTIGSRFGQNKQVFSQVLMNEYLADRREAIQQKYHPDFQPEERR